MVPRQMRETFSPVVPRLTYSMLSSALFPRRVLPRIARETRGAGDETSDSAGGDDAPAVEDGVGGRPGSLCPARSVLNCSLRPRVPIRCTGNHPAAALHGTPSSSTAARALRRLRHG